MVRAVDDSRRALAAELEAVSPLCIAACIEILQTEVCAFSPVSARVFCRMQGAGASIPDELDASTAQELAGDKWDADMFQKMANAGIMTKAQFEMCAAAVMAGGGGASAEGEDQYTEGDYKPPPAANMRRRRSSIGAEAGTSAAAMAATMGINPNDAAAQAAVATAGIMSQQTVVPDDCVSTAPVRRRASVDVSLEDAARLASGEGEAKEDQ
jgi:hypothetical protein